MLARITERGMPDTAAEAEVGTEGESPAIEVCKIGSIRVISHTFGTCQVFLFVSQEEDSEELFHSHKFEVLF